MFASVKLKDLLLIPNLISLSRILLLPFAIYFLSLGDEGLWECVILVSLIVLSDYLDGLLSRLLNQVSDLGKLLDPLADKIVIVGFSLALVLYRDFPLWFFVFLLLRDIILIGGGNWLYRTKGIVVMANSWGKATTVTLACLAFLYLFKGHSGYVSTIFIYLSLGLSIMSAIVYTKESLAKLKGTKN
ncbi:MAG: CDP-diacylglycerol--glycerol-3-phosphate 3-phosphatidyltransferase [bacterium]|nr:MAG: CDP-diacylglycerol--glycerol-3-phosphate 3-phosphatidyltransferase [bacterium]